MGCNASVSNEEINQITEEQIQEIKAGTISPFSYQILLNNFYFVSRYDRFYTELPLDKQLLVLDNVGPLSKDECKTVVEYFCKNAASEEELVQTLIQVSRRMICKTKVEGHDEEVYIPVGLEKTLWKSIMEKKYETKFGKFKMSETSVDWTNSELIQSRDVFLGDLQNQIHETRHSKDLSLLISNNPVDNIWKKGIDTENISTEINRDAKKPLFWEPNIHEASFKGKKSSVEYDLALIPQMLNLPDCKDNTPVHYAAMGNQKNVLIYLKDVGADFKLMNSDGFMPIHLISNKSVINTMNDLGININERNANGESLLDIKTRIFDKAMIKTMIGLGVNILEPNPDGVFWIQTALAKEYFGSAMNEEKFVSFVRKLLINNKKGDWNYNPIYEEVIQRKEKTHVKEDLKDLNKSVLNQDIDRISVLLAIGTKPDVVLDTGETNLYLCAKRGLNKSAEILLKNYANPNFTNSQHENTFWVATINEHFDTALILRDHGADMNIIDKNNETLMHNVYRRKVTKIFEFVLEAGASPNIKNGKCQTVTFIAFLNKDDVVAEKLQDNYKGDINAQDHKMWSLVHHAFSNGDFKRIEYLSNRNIDMDLKNNKGHSVLMMAFFTEINFDTWNFLLEKGSNINTVDFQNNSLLHHLFFMKNAREDVFRFLMDHKIDYDIENYHGQFAISIAIEMSHDKFGFELLDLNCKILDQKSIHEPICEALKRGSQKWFEALVNHGADGMNEKIGVISRYINSGFFKYEVFKKIPRMNIFLEAPLQMAIYKKFNDCSNDLWNMATTESMKVKLAANKDCNGRIVLSAALIMKNESFVNKLLDTKYDILSCDNKGKTPFIYACISNVLPWMTKLFELIPLSNANAIDDDHCAALTYAAENNQKDFCDYLFCKYIEIQGFRADSHGIIEHYRDLMDRYSKAVDSAYENYNDAKHAVYEVESDMAECERRRKELEYEINSIQSEIDRYNDSPNRTFEWESNLKSKKSSCERSIRKYNEMEARVQRDLQHANQVLDHYENQLNEIREAKRYDILHNISHLESLGYRDIKIGQREFYIDWEKIGALALGVLLCIL